MSEKDTQDFKEIIEARIIKTKKRKRSDTFQNTSIELKGSKKLKNESENIDQKTNLFPISTYINNKVNYEFLYKHFLEFDFFCSLFYKL